MACVQALRGYSDGTLSALRLGFEQGYAKCAATEESSQAAINAQFTTKLGELSAEVTALKATAAANKAAAEKNAGIADQVNDKIAPQITALDTAVKAVKKDVLLVSDSAEELTERADSLENTTDHLTKTLKALNLQVNPPCQSGIKWVRFFAGEKVKVLGKSDGIKDVTRIAAGQSKTNRE